MIRLTDEQKERAINDYIFDWEDEEIEAYRQYTWAIIDNSVEDPLVEIFPYRVVVYIDDLFYEDIDDLTPADYNYILYGGNV